MNANPGLDDEAPIEFYLIHRISENEEVCLLSGDLALHYSAVFFEKGGRICL